MKSTSLNIAVLGFLVVTTPEVSLSAENGAATSAAPTKDYVVFFGLEVFADQGGKRRPVVDGSGREVLVAGADGKSTVPLKEASLQSEVTPRLSRSGATIESLTGEPVFSPATNPMAQAQSQQITLENIQADAQERSDIGLRDAQAALSNAMRSGDSRLIADAEAKVGAANTRLSEAHSTPALRGTLPGTADDGSGHDGFEVTFRASAPESRQNAYGVLRLLVRTPQQPQTALEALKIFRIPELTPKPRKTIVRFFGLPPGSAVESYYVHIFADGQELATNLSPNRVELSEDEAHQYLILRHTHVNRSATLPAQVVAEFQSSESRPQLIAGQEASLVNLSISAEGRVEQIVDDAAISAALSPEIQAAVREVRFLPALVAGKPAASTGTFALGELLL